jgi:hypothetical protein
MTNPETLSGQQIQAIRQQMLNEFQRALDDVELRKIALNAANEVVKAYTTTPGIILDTSAVVSLAREMHAFLSEGAAGLAK